MALVRGVLLVIGILLVFLSLPTIAGSDSQPFTIIETTRYGYSENLVYVEFRDNLDKDQAITEIRFEFADSSKTRTISIKEFLLLQEYEENVYGSVNENIGKYEIHDQDCRIENGTVEVCDNYYYDNLNNLMDCDFVLEDKSCMKTVRGVVGQETKEKYLPTPNTKEKIIQSGVKIEQKVSGSVPIPKGSSARIRITMPHLLFTHITIEDWENKYSIWACSQYGCVELDPDWWDDNNYDFHYLINTNTTTAFTPTNVTLGGHNYWVQNATGSTGDEVYAVCQSANCVADAVAFSNTTDEKCWFNETDGTGNCPDDVSDDNLLIWVNFNNVTGSQVSGSGIVDLSVTGTPNIEDGVFGKAWWMDSASASYGRISNANGGAVLEGKSAGTVCGWIWINSTGAGVLFSSAATAVLRASGSARVNAFYYTADADQELQTLAGDPFIANKWFFLCSVYDGSDMFVYNNGTLLLTSAAVGGNIDAGGQPLGFADDGGGTGIYSGSIDDVRIYDRALSQKEIQDMYYQFIGNHTYLTITPLGLSLILPTNTSYGSGVITINGTTGINGNITYSVDGAANKTACEICMDFENYTSALSEGAHNISVYAVAALDATSTESATVFFTVDLSPPTIIIDFPTGTYLFNSSIPLNFVATDAASTVDSCWYSLNNATNVSIGACANTTISPTQAGTHNISVFVNDTAGNTGADDTAFTYAPLMDFRADDSMTGENITNFQVVVVDQTSASTTNGTVLIPLSEIEYGTHTVRFIAAGYNSTDFTETFYNTTLLNRTFTILPAIVNITVYDEQDAGIGVWTNLTINITISNSTTSNTWHNQSTFSEYANATPTGDVTVDISSYGYQPRRYYFTINSNTAQDFTGYLLKTADALYVRFHIRTITEQSIEGASVTATRFLNSSWVTVGQQVSDEAGTAAIYLYPTATYQINVTATGYTGTILTLQPSNQDYRVYLTSGTGGAGFITNVTNITVLFEPTTLALNITRQNFTWWVISSDCSLEWVAFNLTWYNGTVIYNNLTSTTCGIKMNASVNAHFENGTNLTARGFFKKSGYDPYNLTRTYYFVNMTGGHLGAALSNTGLSQMSLGIISVLVSMFVAGFITKLGNNGKAGAAGGMIILAICTFYFNFLDWRVFTLMTMTLGSVIVLRGGI